MDGTDAPVAGNPHKRYRLRAETVSARSARRDRYAGQGRDDLGRADGATGGAGSENLRSRCRSPAAPGRRPIGSQPQGNRARLPGAAFALRTPAPGAAQGRNDAPEALGSPILPLRGGKTCTAKRMTARRTASAKSPKASRSGCLSWFLDGTAMAG